MPTEYNGIQFRSRMEARWAVFFDQCGVEWEYERKIWKVADNLWYLPDFLLHNVDGRVNGDLYVEIKGCMGNEDKRKILGLAEKFPVLVLGDLPCGMTMREIEEEESIRAYENIWGGEPYEYNFETIDGDHFGVHLGVNKSGNFELFGDDCSYTCDRDDVKTLNAYIIARNSFR